MKPQRRVTLSIFLVGLLLSFSLAACDVSLDDDDAEGEPTQTAQIAAQATVTPNQTATAQPATPTEGAQATPGRAGRDSTGVPDGSTDFSTAIEQVVKDVSPAVPYIAVTSVSPGPFGSQQPQQGVGSGVIFDEEGHVLTNNHVVEGAQQIQVILSDGREFEGKVIGRAPTQDIAVIKIEGDDLPVATLGNSNDLKVGEWVVAIGNALGLQGGATVTTGIVSALNRAIGGGAGQPELENLVQTDAAINPGNSGGPLVNLNGEVIGINTATIQGAEGIGFAVAIDEAERIIQEILTGEPGPYLGISGAEITPGLAARYNLPVESGILIANVEPGGPADQAGIQAGDIFVSLDGTELTSVDELRAALSEHQPGDQVTITILREGSEQEVTVTLGETSIVLEE